MVDEAPVVDLQPKQEPSWKKYASIVLFIVIVIAVLALLFISTRLFVTIDEDTPAPLVESIPKNASQPVEVGMKFNFFPYIHQADAYVGRDVTLYGFLTQLPGSSVGTPIYALYILDDDGRKVKLSGVSDDEMRMIPKDTATLEIYRVDGVMQKTYSTYSVLVKSMAVVERPSV
ncbi:TPA: hypothetical protein HA251_06020 [Candidatus Woesearchaeota archaeon]|nr:hypothetical protein [Candidatus Woesearchaeota archaeon]